MRFQIAAGLAAIASANSTPIYGKYPGWTEGSDRLGIQLELFEDYLCGDCKAFNPVFEEVLATKWLDGTVKDQIEAAYTPIALPYHVHAYQVHQLVPYFMDLCDAGTACLSNEYKDFSFANRDDILAMTNVGIDDFEAWWAKTVAEEFSLPEADVTAVYHPSDPDPTHLAVATLWKYATGKGVNTTPTVFVNGVKLDSVPLTVEDWMTLLNQVYDSQYGVVSAVEHYVQN